MLLLALLIVCFLYLSGLMAMIDAAVLSVSTAEVEAMVARELWGARSLRYLKRHITSAVVVIVVLTNIINVLGPIIVGYKAVELYGNAIIGIVTAVLTFGTIVFSEIIPKSIGSHYAPQISRLVAPTIRLLIWVFYPLVYILEKVTAYFKSGTRKIGTEEQIRSLVTLGRKAGHIQPGEGQLIHRAFVLNDKTAREIMKPMEQVVFVTTAMTVREAAQVIFREPYSRYPVFDDNQQVLGLLLSKDVLQAVSLGKDEDNVQPLMREGFTVPADMSCDDLLTLFRDKRTHLAVVQADNVAIGLVTLEDVLEQLVGDIEDEKDG